MATRSLVDILLYISFFPHLVAGPIVRAKIFLEQTIRRSDPKDIRLGMSVFLIVGGLFKKVIVANYLSTDFVDGVFRAPTEYSRLDLLLGMYAYALQIYCDFSAYTDIAIGVANLLGYQFPQNFNQPYRALVGAGFLAPLAHHAVELAARLSLHPARRQSRRHLAHLSQYPDHHAAGRPLAWCELEFRHLGRLARRGAGDRAPVGRDRRGRQASHICASSGWFITFHFVCLTWVFFRAPTFDDAQAYLSTLMFGEAVFTTTVTPLVADDAGARRADPDHSEPLVRQPGEPITIAPRSP